jgi:transcriptional antiterminator NusG
MANDLPPEEETRSLEGDQDEYYDEDEIGPLPEKVISPEALLKRFGLEEGEKVEEAEEPEEEEEPEAEVIEEEEPAELLPDPFEIPIEGEELEDQREWFVIHCYSGYEYKVKHNLEQRIESMGMQDYIFQVVVPTIEEIEIRDGKRRTVERCLFPGYIMVQMILSDDSWYVVRNTPGVTGFVGMGNMPTPLRPEAVQGILRRMEAAAPQIRATFKIGQKVRISEGPFADFIGMVDDIDEERTKVRVLVSFFGRETPVELDFLQVEKA